MQIYGPQFPSLRYCCGDFVALKPLMSLPGTMLTSRPDANLCRCTMHSTSFTPCVLVMELGLERLYTPGLRLPLNPCLGSRTLWIVLQESERCVVRQLGRHLAHSSALPYSHAIIRRSFKRS